MLDSFPGKKERTCKYTNKLWEKKTSREKFKSSTIII